MGKFIISLDFEMFWGVRDNKTIENYGSQILNEHIIIPRLLELFEKYEISATWAIVGLLFCKNKFDIIKYLPSYYPTYINQNLNPYNKLSSVGENYSSDKYHYGRHLVDEIRKYTSQEIATHTFGHFYCLEPGQSIDQFESDIKSALSIADNELGIKLNSIIFPRNQYASTHLESCKKLGLVIYRGNENHWAYSPYSDKENIHAKRIFRLIDSYVNLSGHHTYCQPKPLNGITNLPASKFLRPYSSSLKLFEFLKIKRIKQSMLYAARNNEIYHLWWHPHNFGLNMENNFQQLEEILIYYTLLRKRYGMTSYCMREASN